VAQIPQLVWPDRPFAAGADDELATLDSAGELAATAAGRRSRRRVSRTIRPWHDLRHTALTHDAAAGNPAVYVQARAGHAQAKMTERYVHAAQVAFPGAAEKAEARLFAGVND
jgi:integrase